MRLTSARELANYLHTDITVLRTQLSNGSTAIVTEDLSNLIQTVEALQDRLRDLGKILGTGRGE